MSIAFEEPNYKPESLTRVVFHIENANGLDEVFKDIPKTLAAYVTVESPEISSDKYDLTSSGYSNDRSQPTWNDNLQAMRLRLDAPIKFSLNHLYPRSATRPFKKQRNAALAQTDTYTLNNLFMMQAEADALFTNPGDLSPKSRRNAISLPLHTNSKSKTRQQANLFVSLHKILEGAELQQELQKDLEEIQKKKAAQDELESYLNQSTEELIIAESRVVSSSTTTIINRIHIAIGALSSVSQVVINNYTKKDTTSIQLVSSILELIIRLNSFNDENMSDQCLKHVLIEIINASSLLNRYFIYGGIRHNVENTIARFQEFHERINPMISNNTISQGSSSSGGSSAILSNGIGMCDVVQTPHNPKLNKLNAMTDMKPPFRPNNNLDFSIVIQKISKWIFSPKKQPPNIFHLCGPKGSGKGSLITNIVQEFKELGYMSGYFSFEPLDKHSTSMLSMLMPTLAFQLSKSLPEIMGHICKALEETPGILGLNLTSQFDKLLRVPLQALETEKEYERGKGFMQPVIIVLDKLDKCDTAGTEDLDTLLELLATEFSTLPDFVHFVVVSRHMENIELKLSVNPAVMKHELLSLGPKSIKRPTKGKEVSFSDGEGKIESKIHFTTTHAKRISLCAKVSGNLDTIAEIEKSGPQVDTP